MNALIISMPKTPKPQNPKTPLNVVKIWIDSLLISDVASKKGLTGFEDHLVCDWEQLIDEQPSAISAAFVVVTIFD